MAQVFLLPSSNVGLARFDSLRQLGRRVLPVSLWVVLDPSPQIGACLLHGALRLPLELGVGQGRIGREVEHVTLAPFYHLVG